MYFDFPPLYYLKGTDTNHFVPLHRETVRRRVGILIIAAQQGRTGHQELHGSRPVDGISHVCWGSGTAGVIEPGGRSRSRKLIRLPAWYVRG